MCRSSYSLDIFQQTPNKSELAKELVTRKLIRFQMLSSKSQENYVSSSIVGKT
jgi:hypothetical protein